MPVSMWRYLKWGACLDCGDAQGRLHVPVINAEGPSPGHIPHFRPVCGCCMKNYTLDILCDDHRLPIRFSDQRCQLCVK